MSCFKLIRYVAYFIKTNGSAVIRSNAKAAVLYNLKPQIVNAKLIPKSIGTNRQGLEK